MASVDKEIIAKFKPRARLLTQLGNQLIKNESIALIELVKNSYDADATEVNICMEGVDNPETGKITIEDDGCGMSALTVENVWLEPGSDFKAKKLANKAASPKFKRLPIGEKGIGRFGVHKLGNVIEMVTKAEGAKEVFIKIDWSKFDDYEYLEQVPIVIKERARPLHFKNGNTGTKITISSLRQAWERGIAREVKRSMTALTSPFETNDSFSANLEIPDKPKWFDGLLSWEKVKDYSLYHFKIMISGSAIKKFEYEFTPWASMPKLSKRTVQLKKIPISEVERYVDNFKTLQRKDEKGKAEFFSLENDNDKVGKIIFEGYIFDQDPFILNLGVSDKTGYKEYLKANGGVRVFRDGLRVYDYGEHENDWLDLDYRRFQRPGRSISNNLILGAVYLNRESSTSLIEKTNREGFVDNSAYKKFKSAILHCIELIETLRLQDKTRLRETYGATPKSEPVMHVLGEAKKYVEEKVHERPIKNQIIKYLNKVEDDYKRISENLLKAAGAGLSMSVVIHEVEKIIAEVEKVLINDGGSERVLNLVKHLSSLIDGYAEIIRGSSRTTEDLKKIIDQALFNIEYRLSAHKIKVIPSYKQYSGNSRVSITRSPVIGALMNLIDNSIFWLERAYKANRNLDKKLFIGLAEDNLKIYLIVADNGTGFLIPTENLKEPFVSGKPDGIGLGLHIASEVLLAQKGLLIFPDKGDFELPSEFNDGAILAFAFSK